MMLQSWTTERIHPRDRIDAWRAHLASQSHPKAVELSGSSGFRATMASMRLGDLYLKRVSSVPQLISAREERREAAYAVAVNIAGGARIEQNGTVCLLKPVDLAVFRVGQGHRVSFSNDWEQLVLIVPGGLFEAVFPAAAEVTPLRIAGEDPFAALAAASLLCLASKAASLDDDAGRELAVHALRLVASAGQRSVDPGRLASSTDRALRMQRVKQFIELNLHRPELRPSMIAAENGLSERSLHRLFEDMGMGVAAYVRSRRLATGATALRDPYQRGRSIAEIAYASGFTSASVFSRVFRDRYGATPRAYRYDASPIASIQGRRQE